MERAELETRLAEIEKAIEQLTANVNVLIGRKLELQFWLEKLGSDGKVGDGDGDDGSKPGGESP